MTKFQVVAAQIAFVAAAAVFAYSQPYEDTKPVVQAKQMQQTIEGCLESAETNSYMLITEDGQKVLVAGSPTLAEHVGTKVRLTGTMNGDGDQATFQASKVEEISPTCG